MYHSLFNRYRKIYNDFTHLFLGIWR